MLTIEISITTSPIDDTTSVCRKDDSPYVKFSGLGTEMANLRRALSSLAHFGAGFTLNVTEKSIADAILAPLCDSLILSNDYYSWEKERGVQMERLMNCVSFFMKWHSLSEIDAKEITKTKIIELEENYLAQKAKYLSKTDRSQISQVVLDSLELAEAVAAGFSLWSITCPRYDPSDENVYKTYYQRRLADGFYFFDSCTDSDMILSHESGLNFGAQTNGGEQRVIGNCENGPTRDVTQSTGSESKSLVVSFISILPLISLR